MTILQLRLSNVVQAEPAGAAPVPLAARDAALLAWLAVEGPTSRERLGALFWPESSAAQARTTLRQRLFQLRKALGREVAKGSPTLELDAGIEHDLLESTEILGDLCLPDAPEVDLWLRRQREQRHDRELQALRAQAQAQEDAGDLSAALSVAQALLRLTPLSEAAHQRVMRLHYLLGDRAAALAAFDACEQVLKHEIGARPAAETLALLATIEAAGPLALADPASPRPVPAGVLRPPRMVGREPELGALAQAWAAGQVAALMGEAGMGKSRLLQEFTLQHPEIVRSAGRPGDAGVPFATLARLLRAVGTKAHPPASTLAPELTQELARVLPEMGAVPSRHADADRLRLRRAVIAFLQRSGAGGLALDDLHFADLASLEMLQALIDEDAAEAEADPALAATPLRWILSFRPAEAAAPLQQLQQGLIEMARLVPVRVSALDLTAIEKLVDGLELPGVEGARVAPLLHQRTGGNPLFVLETLKQAWVTQQLPQLAAGRLPARTVSVGQLIDARVARLSAGALALARVASIAEADFSIALAEQVLGSSAMRFADALAELETAQVLVGTQFAHDLVFDAVLRSVPRAIAEHTHAEVARWLAQQNGEPARIARHWIAARRAEQALPWLEQAAQRARDALRNVEQLQFLDLRAEIEASLGQRAAAFETGLAALLVYADHEREATQCAQRCDVLEALADSDAQRIRVCIERANVATRRREMEQAESLARRALAAAQLSGETALVQRSQITLFEVLVTTLQNAEALSLGEACLGWISDASDREWRRNLHAALGVLYDNTGQLERALAQIAIARRACEGHPEEGNIAVLLGNEAALLVQAGKARQAWEQGQAALRLAAQLERVTSTGPELLTLANAAVLLGQYGSALHWADRAEQVLREAAPAGVAIAENYRATCHLHLGQRARALQCLQRIGDDPTAMLSARVRMHQLRCRLSREVGEATLPHVEAGLALLPEGARPNQRASLRIERALGLPGPQALVELQAVHDFAQRCGYTGHVLEARMHAARIAVTVSTALAREHALAALNLARQCEPVVSYRGELWLCCARAFEACGDVQRLRAVLTEAFDWIAATAEQQVPAEFRDSFLNRNPVNRDLRAWASRLDIAGSASTLARGG